MAETKQIELYICGVDWQHEVGGAGDCVFHESLEAFKRTAGLDHLKQCGIVKLRATLELVEWVEPQDLWGKHSEGTTTGTDRE